MELALDMLDTVIRKRLHVRKDTSVVYRAHMARIVNELASNQMTGLNSETGPCKGLVCCVILTRLMLDLILLRSNDFNYLNLKHFQRLSSSNLTGNPDFGCRIDECVVFGGHGPLGVSLTVRSSVVPTSLFLFLLVLGGLPRMSRPDQPVTAVRGTGASLTSHYPPFVPGAPLNLIHGPRPCDHEPPGSPPALSKNPHCPEPAPGAWHESSGMLIYNYRIKREFFSLSYVFIRIHKNPCDFHLFNQNVSDSTRQST